jgi:hypothetical protein
MNQFTPIITRRVVVAVLAAGALATALPQAGLAQNNPLTGTWKLNLAKSKYSPGPPPKSATLTYRADGNFVRRIADGVDADGKPTKSEWMHIYDGNSYSTTGVPGYDATAYTRVDARNINFIRTNAGKPAQTGSIVISADGKSLTITTSGTGANGQPFNNVAFYDKQ